MRVPVVDAAAEGMIEKQRALRAFIAAQGSRAIAPAPDLKIYFSEISHQTRQRELETFLRDDGNHYVEDFGTYCVVLDWLRRSFGTDDPRDADFVALPINIGVLLSPYYDDAWFAELEPGIAGFRRDARGKIPLLFCVSDFCFRPIARTTPVEAWVMSRYAIPGHRRVAWIDHADTIIHLESTTDFPASDIAIFPLVGAPLVAPSANTGEFLYSFVGEITKHRVPDCFVRSPAQAQTWARLGESSERKVFVGSPDEARSLVAGDPFFEMPARSVFTLCPRGVAIWSFRIFEAIRGGSIPVILADAYVKPFEGRIPWPDFCLHLPEQSLAEVPRLLTSMGDERLRSLRAALERHQPSFFVDGLMQSLAAELARRRDEHALR